MSEFGIYTNKVEMTATDIGLLKKELKAIESELFSLGNNIAFKSQGTIRVKMSIKKVEEQIEAEAGAVEALSNVLTTVAAICAKYEQNCIDNIGGANTKGEDSSSSERFENKENNNDDDGAFQEAIDFLNSISLSTSIDGVLLSVVEYLIKLYDMTADTAMLGTLGRGAGIVGLITGVAADIWSALDNGSSQNALIADIIVDVGLWGVGEGATALGSAVGTAVGGPVGTVVGNFVGGLVGNGVSIAMNIDWNGDAEGGIGKDALTDWIDNQLDKFIEDGELSIII